MVKLRDVVQEKILDHKERNHDKCKHVEILEVCRQNGVLFTKLHDRLGPHHE